MSGAFDTTPALVLRSPAGGAVAHLLLTVPAGASGQALSVLGSLAPSFGVRDADQLFTSVGFSFAGLAALGLPERHQRVFQRLAPAFWQGAARRSVRLGDGGPNAVMHWDDAFRQDGAHVLVSWHGPALGVQHALDALQCRWEEQLRGGPGHVYQGARLGSPDKDLEGEWVHFGFRDGLSEVQIDDAPPAAADPRPHAPGTLLLGHVDDAGGNRFALPRARDKARGFFHHGSFGIFRPMTQDLAAFEQQVDLWTIQLNGLFDPPVTRDFVKAKLCGRWPDGRVLKPGQITPDPMTTDALKLPDLALQDPAGQGCPFGSHVRRMRASPGADGNLLERPLQRRSVPFGPPSWNEAPKDGQPRGLLGHFFCASIEDQFEHLLGQWAARPPLGFALDDQARDPFIGPHEDADAALAVPLDGLQTQHLRGFGGWTRTLGTMYAWYPDSAAWQVVLKQDYVPIEDEEPWL